MSTFTEGYSPEQVTTLLAEAERAVEYARRLQEDIGKIRDEARRARKLFEQHPDFRGRQPLRNIEELADDALASM